MAKLNITLKICEFYRYIPDMYHLGFTLMLIDCLGGKLQLGVVISPLFSVILQGVEKYKSVLVIFL